MSAPSSIDVVRRAISAWNERDVEACLALFHPDAELDWSRSYGPLPGIFRGHPGLLLLSAEYWSMYADMLVVPDEFIAVGEQIVVPNRGHHRGRGGGELVARSTYVYSVRGGRVFVLRVYQDLGEALDAAYLAVGR
jgi:ketosteroid isomerase-like protein